MSILEQPDGTIWFSRMRLKDERGPLCKIVGDHAVCFGESDGVAIKTAHQLVTDAQGNFWTYSATTVMRWKPGSSHTFVPTELGGKGGIEDTFDVFQGIAPAPDGSVWVGAMQPKHGLGLLRIVDNKLEAVVTPEFDGRKLRVSSLLLDRQDVLWIGTQGEGLYRLHGGQVSHYRASDGLSNDTVQALFEDREGTLWVLTTQGIDAFRDLKVSSVTSRQGLSADLANSVLATRDGTVWINAWHSLDALKDGHFTSFSANNGLPGGEVTAMFEDRAGTLWVGIDDDLYTLHGKAFQPFKRSDGRSIGFVEQMTQDVAGDLWVMEAKSNELLRIHDRRVTEEISRTTVPFAFAQTIVPDPRGGIWFPLTNGDLARYRSGSLETVAFHRAPHTGLIWGLLSDQDGSIIGATSLGLIGWREGRSQTMTEANGLPCLEIHTLQRDRHDDLWLYASCGIIRIANDQIKEWWSDPAAHLKFKLFDALDGAQTALGEFFPRSTMSPDGRLWFANGSIVQVVDPDQLGGNSIPPPVIIEKVVANRQSFLPSPGLTLPPQVRDLQIDYTALSLVVPRQNHFRYRLTGHDTDWQDAGTRRQAFYTDLPPGAYRFHVIASNNDAVWNNTGATLDFFIRPTFYQTSWFILLCLVAALAAIALIFRLRVRQIAARLRAMLDARNAERERIARELHDTLLQGTQGLMLQVQAAANAMSPNEAAHLLLERAMERADDVMTEGRDRVLDLRDTNHPYRSLSRSIETVIQGLQTPMTGATDTATAYRLTVDGDERELLADTWHEVYCVGREALLNASRHAAAQNVEVQLRFAKDSLRLLVLDDGVGIDVAKARSLPGHFGLAGMQERAKKVSARFEVRKRASGGTEVEIVVPAAIAYKIKSLTLWQRMLAFASRGDRAP